MKLDVLDINGKSTGRKVDLPDHIFKVEPNEHAMYLAVKLYNANQRQGTHKTKERGEISFSTRKVKRQKGTGTARAGSMRNPLFRKGGRIFGPRPRNYGFKLNKKVKQLARHSALSTKISSGGIKVVEDFTFDAPKDEGIYFSDEWVGGTESKDHFGDNGCGPQFVLVDPEYPQCGYQESTRFEYL